MRRLHRTLALALAAAVFGMPAVVAAQAPNLSGTWALDAAKSDFGPMAQMMGETPKITMVIEHKEPALSMKTTTTTSRGERTSDQSLTTDGKEVTTTNPRGGTAVSSAKWEGGNLVITSRRTTPQGELTQVQTMILSADGKTLTIDGRAQTPMGEFTTTQVFVKQ
ncbi:MAG: hypothetical protein ACK53A_07990 [Gemmatimonadota bacterium]|jgi:hypothetical protein|nr:hypothetical protein [Gemmatimonadota bacterium]